MRTSTFSPTLGHMQIKTTNILTTMKMERKSHRFAFLKISANTQMAHLVLPNSQAETSQNQKSHFLSTLI
jgi:hypothetical protein